ncbi:synaptic vesicle glycoprotein 2B-like [Anoplophora glabripennis]|uniref:synaptic vesicle glycoprotein 2B-like n=1 Tax=Anoplophora glabripennis TaxID=217634 RepID=UPI000873AF5D|nr:synaptic vesicle glycoprotein 2B-like [Anoplophora glabripennis]
MYKIKNSVPIDVIELYDITDEDSKKFKEIDEKPADFETAITACGFGKFNIILYIISTAAGWSSVFETTTMSYVFPAAECDLELKLSHKGLLNAVTYSGMISSAVIWGFLCDTLGRRKLLLIGFLLDALFFLMAASSQSFTLLMIAKFLGGFIINGPFAALTSYLSEFHNAHHRARVQMVLGTIFSFGNLALPLLALGVLPIDINVKMGEYFVFHSWNLYLLICSLPALISGIAFIFLPESPKFLMTMGRNEKALQVFRKVYRMNTGKPESTFPVKELVDETKVTKENSNKRGGHVTANRTKVQAMREGWQQIKPLFFPPHVAKFILVFTIQCLIMMSLNTLRLWLPQIFQAINDYQYYNNETASLCVMMEVFQPKNMSINATECVVNYNNSRVYANSMIVAFTSMVGYITAGTLINTLGKKKLLCILGTVSGTMAMSLYFSRNTPTTVVLSALFIAFGSIGINVILAVVVDLFPTTLRTMTVSLTMMFGRAGAVLGNLVFPFLLEAGCAPPFFAVGSVMLGCAFLTCLLPNTDMKALQ